MNLNVGKHLHLVVLDYKLSPSAESTFIPLQSGNTFRAIKDITSQRREYPIELLDGGMVSHDAVVTLQDSTTLRAVEIIPGRLPYQFTPLDEKIIHAAISVAQIEGSAYRSFREGLPEEDAKRTVVTGAEFIEFVDGFKFIDLASWLKLKSHVLS